MSVQFHRKNDSSNHTEDSSVESNISSSGDEANSSSIGILLLFPSENCLLHVKFEWIAAESVEVNRQSGNDMDLSIQLSNAERQLLQRQIDERNGNKIT